VIQDHIAIIIAAPGRSTWAKRPSVDAQSRRGAGFPTPNASSCFAGDALHRRDGIGCETPWLDLRVLGLQARILPVPRPPGDVDPRLAQRLPYQSTTWTSSRSPPATTQIFHARHDLTRRPGWWR
jgi:hypothetical protein